MTRRLKTLSLGLVVLLLFSFLQSPISAVEHETLATNCYRA